MKTTIIVVAVLAALAAPVRAQAPQVAKPDDHPLLTAASYVALVSGNIADLWTTKDGLNRGAVEWNPLFANMSFTGIAATKAILVSGMAVTMHLMATHGHPKAARVVGFLNGGIAWGAALHNIRVAR